MKSSLILLALASASQAFFFGSSGSGCGCSAPPSCPPPAPAPVCPPAPSCGCGGGGGYAVAAAAAPVYQTSNFVAPAAPAPQQYGYVRSGPIAQAAPQVNVAPAETIDHQLVQEIAYEESVQGRRIKRDEGEQTFDPKCNSEVLRNLILKNIHPSTATAKRQIQSAAAEEVGGRIDVICSTGTFSYIVNTELYCETEKNGITCFAFKQAD